MIEQILAQPSGSLENLTVNLDSLPMNQKYETLEKILDKISREGSITVTGLDVFTFGHWITYAQKTVDDINSVLENTRSLDTMDNIKRFLLAKNFKTINAKRDNGYYVCTARYSL